MHQAEFESQITKHRAFIFHIVKRIVADSADAEEVTQDALLMAWRKLGSFRGDSKFSTWLGRIAMNEAFRLHRVNRSQRRQHIAVPLDEVREDGLQLAEIIADERPLAIDRILRNEQRKLVQSAVSKLSHSYRVTMTMRYLQECDIHQTMEALNVSEGAVKSYCSRGRDQLRARLLGAPIPKRRKRARASASEPQAEARTNQKLEEKQAEMRARMLAKRSRRLAEQTAWNKINARVALFYSRATLPRTVAKT